MSTLWLFLPHTFFIFPSLSKIFHQRVNLLTYNTSYNCRASNDTWIHLLFVSHTSLYKHLKSFCKHTNYTYISHEAYHSKKYPHKQHHQACSQMFWFPRHTIFHLPSTSHLNSISIISVHFLLNNSIIRANTYLW